MFSQYKGLRKEIYVLSFGRLVTSLGSMVWSMVTLILSQKMGMSPGTIAVLMAAANLLVLPVSLLGGRLADRCNKKWNIILCDIVSIAGYIVCGILPLSYGTLILIFVSSLFQNMEHPSYVALLADLTKTEDRERAYSLQYMCANLGLVLAPTIAGLLFVNHLPLCFLINGCSIACSTVMIFFLVRDITPIKEGRDTAFYQQSRESESLWHILQERPIILIYVIVVGLYSGLYHQYNVLMPQEMGHIHGEQGALIFGSITSVNCIVVVAFTPLITRLTHKMPEPKKMLAGNFFLLAGFAVYVLCTGIIPMYYVGMMIFTWGEILMMLSESPYTTKRIPASHRGRISGLNAVSTAVLSAVCQLIVGFFYERGGSGSGWMSVYGIGAVMLVFTLILIRRDRKVFSRLYNTN